MTLEDLRIALIELDEKRTVRSAQELLAGGEAPPQSILSTCQNALRVVGERYERQEYYLSALIMAGEIFTRVLKLVEPDTEPVPERDPPGRWCWEPSPATSTTSGRTCSPLLSEPMASR